MVRLWHEANTDKRKKLNLVFHVIVTVGSGCICYLTPDIIGIKLGDMLKTAIKHVCPSEQAAQRALFALFIDHR